MIDLKKFNLELIKCEICEETLINKERFTNRCTCAQFLIMRRGGDAIVAKFIIMEDGAVYTVSLNISENWITTTISHLGEDIEFVGIIFSNLQNDKTTMEELETILLLI